MKKLSKIAALALAAALSVSLAACGGGSASPSPSASAPAPSASQPAESAPAAGEKYVVGICQLAPHVALDAATQGFKDAIEEALPGQVEFKDGNAAGDSPTCATIVNGFVSDGVDLIMANATPPSRPRPPPPATSPYWAPPLRNTAWPWASTALPAPWAPMCPAPPTLPPWTSRLP